MTGTEYTATCDAAYYLGCPVWACDRWRGSLFSRHAPRSEWLNQYSQAFNAVEGNSTFYALPSFDTIQRWAESVTVGFRFALKFPRAISHEKRLIHAEPETREFLRVLEVLREAGHLGPSFLQLPRGFSAAHLGDLEIYLKRLPADFPYAVELRNSDYFDQTTTERAVCEMLGSLRIDRVIFDSRALFSADPSDEAEKVSQSRKPRLPIHTAVTGQHPMLRFIGRDDLGCVTPWIHEWTPLVAQWIGEGRQPYIFTHTPDEVFAPQFARRFHDDLLRHSRQLPALPPWPGEIERAGVRQLELF